MYVNTNTVAVAVQLRFGALLIVIASDSYSISISIPMVVSRLLFNPNAMLGDHIPSLIEMSASSIRF
jgi:hypothetical protein